MADKAKACLNCVNLLFSRFQLLQIDGFHRDNAVSYPKKKQHEQSE